MLNNKRKCLYTLIYFSKCCFSRRNECIFEIRISIIFKIIDNLISNPMKQIWINVELYFESYEFSNF